MQKNKIVMPSEAAYIVGLILIALSVSMVTASDFGVSMIVAPAYILSLKFEALSFGQCEYIVQGLMFIVFCILMKKVKAVYFSSFITCIIYGAVLDLWRWAVPVFNPDITPAGTMALWLRVVLFITGNLLTAFCVALMFHTYIYPQVYDFFVKGISERFNLNLAKFKTAFDISCLLVAASMTLIFFGRFEGIGLGTVIVACANGTVIGFFGKWLDSNFEFKPLFGKFADKFTL